MFDIESVDDFKQIKSYIIGRPDYDKINKDHGHGDLSAALNLYEKYLLGQDDFTEIKKDLPNYMEDNSMTAAERIKHIKTYIASKGFSYSELLIENFYLSLKSKPFVILAGTSGTGKTRLVKLFATAIGAEYRLVSVRPDWSDGSDLLGHTDLNNHFTDGPLLECIKEAESNPEKPFIFCLDEMNLARVEYYLSDYLSVIESRDKLSNGKIATAPIIKQDGKEHGIPDNLYIVGTVNMDETTFPFSKKVLDRANTIEFNHVDLCPNFKAAVSEVKSLKLNNSFLRADYLVLLKDCADEAEYVKTTCIKLQNLNEILAKANAHIGYRVRDEIIFYLLNNKKAGDLMDDNAAMDCEIMQKILPRIQGSSAAIKELLIDLFKYCRDNLSGLDEDGKDIGKQMQQLSSDAAYPNSAVKIAYMMTRFEEDGFTSYWL